MPTAVAGLRPEWRETDRAGGRDALRRRSGEAVQPAVGTGGDRTGDEWLAVEHAEQFAAVLLPPNDQS
ncbi:hypothetical protein ACWELO_05620 [Streptomyces sp. NPDC004596]|uniref:hypothetical protein n=1 Tax=Streptomyces sp. DSM 118148 TaxID=3448667 RepID=UPI0040401CBA